MPLAGAFLILLLPLSIAMCEESSGTPVDDLALKSCDNIVRTLDRGDYISSYINSSAAFKKALVSSDKWSDTLTNIRNPLGKTLSREILSSNAVDKIPGAVDADYVIVQYKTSFENKKESVETVVVIKEGNDWKLAGYFIR